MKIRSAILLASLLASPLLHAQQGAPGQTGAVLTPAAQAKPPVANAGGADPAADPFVREAAPPEGVVEEDRAPRHLSVCVESFSLDMAEAAALRRRITDDSKLYEEILSRVAKGTAAQEYFGIICARSGERSIVENISELIYPTEYAPNESSKPSTAPSGSRAGPSPAAAPASGPTPSPSSLPPLGHSFETRNVGFILEVEPTLNQTHDIIDLRIAPQIVTLVDRSKWGKGNSEVEMPEFENQNMTLALTVRPRKPVLLGTPSRPPASKLTPDAAKKIWFSFVTVSVIKV